jgi:pyruvate/2-oxoglutarate dehydrogenase complex dihydrolipoamide acyltransferase (E2) component
LRQRVPLHYFVGASQLGSTSPDASMRQFLVPDLGIGNKDAKIVAWHVAEGDHIVAEEPLVSLETEKVAVEISSPWSGHVARLLANTGDQVKVGAPLVEFTDAAEDAAAPAVGRLAVRARHVPLAPPSKSPEETHQVLLPDLGIGNKDAEIVTWHVAEGDHIVANEQLVSIETDKATVEIPSPWSGRITRLLANTGDRVRQGAPLVALAVSVQETNERPEPMHTQAVEPRSEPRKPAAPPREPPPMVQANLARPARGTGASLERPPRSTMAPTDLERVTNRVAETDARKRKERKWLTDGNPFVFAVELVVIFLCGLFLVWWIASFG